ncbi:hypothetical protein [Paraglaciecola sp.]|uniref:hypothetical protein n=1 Tax=Paraglaciecola sp. TaxID=1920173 RepID=UPI00326330A7
MKFTAFGLARSGTTALAQLLNSHPEVFCAIEAFLPDKSIADLPLPESLLEPDVVGQKRAIKHAAIITSKHKCFGNKFPRYYGYLDDVSSNCIPNIGIYREGFSFAHSWNERVRAKENWPQGRTGIIGIIEQVILLISLAKLKNTDSTYIFSYERLLRIDKEHFTEVFKLLDVDPELARNRFESQVFNRKKISEVKRTFTENEARAKDYFDIEKVDILLKNNSGISISSYSTDALDSLSLLKVKLESFIQEFSGTFSDLEVQYLKSQLPFFEHAIKEKLYF